MYVFAFDVNALYLTGGYKNGDGDTDLILNFDTTELKWTHLGSMGHGYNMRLHGFGVVLMNDIMDYCKYVAAPNYELFHTIF